MTHSDDNGLVLPPNLAPIQVVIVPIYKGEKQQNEIAEVATQIKMALESKYIRVKFDNRDKFKPGYKFNEYELKGVPVRLAIGMRDVENGTVEVRFWFSLVLKWGLRVCLVMGCVGLGQGMPA